ATLREYRPTIIGGYAGVLLRLAQGMSESDMAAIQPRLILSGGEVLTPAQRRDLKLALDAPVFDTYGSHEFGRIATECMHGGGYHVSAEGVAMEVRASGREVEAGERGEVIGTNLHAFAMPFIRYRLGDLVTRGEQRCACSMPVPTIHSIQGRMVDFFPLADGRTLHPYEIAAAAKQHLLDWVGEYQFLQERMDRVVLRAVPRRAPRPEEVEAVCANVRRVLGPAVSFDVHLLSQLELGQRGKFRVYRSLVRSSYDDAPEEQLSTFDS
ncbi:MAG: phenylacetate--CoA ligase family protein, partial [Longimicrobiales bacterium]